MIELKSIENHVLFTSKEHDILEGQFTRRIEVQIGPEPVWYENGPDNDIYLVEDHMHEILEAEFSKKYLKPQA